MLTNDEIYQSRDVSTAEMVAVMMELKYFDEQFLYYGLAYAEDGVIKYRLNDNPLPLCRFWADCTQKGLYPTGLTQHVQLAKVPSTRPMGTAVLHQLRASSRTNRMTCRLLMPMQRIMPKN